MPYWAIPERETGMILLDHSNLWWDDRDCRYTDTAHGTVPPWSHSVARDHSIALVVQFEMNFQPQRCLFFFEAHGSFCTSQVLLCRAVCRLQLESFDCLRPLRLSLF